MTTLKEQYHSTMTLVEAEKMILQTLKNVMEDGINRDNVEVTVIRSDTKTGVNRTPEELETIINTLS